MSCQNNLKQIGLGMHNYHDAIMELPSGYLYRGGNGKTNYGWAVLILPYIEQGPFSNQLNPIQVPLYKRYKSSATPTDIALLQQTFKIYRCPADTGPPLATDLSFGSKNYFPVALSNYVGCAGWSNTPSYPVKDGDCGGMLWGNSRLKLTACTDGTSNTILVSGAGSGMTTPRPGSASATITHTAILAPCAMLFRAAFTMNFNYVAAGAPENAGKGWSSEHTSGVNVVLSDGSVHFLSDSTNASAVLYPMSMRSDGRVFQMP